MNHRLSKAFRREPLSGPLGAVLGLLLGASALIVVGSALGRGIDLGPDATDVVSVPAARQQAETPGGGVIGALAAALRTLTGGRPPETELIEARSTETVVDDPLEVAELGGLDSEATGLADAVEESEAGPPAVAFAEAPDELVRALAVPFPTVGDDEDYEDYEDGEPYAELATLESRIIAEPAASEAAEVEPVLQPTNPASPPTAPSQAGAAPPAQPTLRPQPVVAAPNSSRAAPAAPTPKPLAAAAPTKRPTAVTTAKPPMATARTVTQDGGDARGDRRER